MTSSDAELDDDVSPSPQPTTTLIPAPDSGEPIPREEEEPYEGQSFPNEESAKLFYDEYARRTGFVMRVMGCRKSEVDGRILARRLGCNKEGFCLGSGSGSGGVRGGRRINSSSGGGGCGSGGKWNNNKKKKRESTREGCKAMVLVKADKTGKWVVTKFLKDHNHPLVVSPREIRQSMDIRDRKIQELNTEIRNKKRLCAIYQDQLTAFMREVEEHGNQLSKKVQTVVKNLKHFGPIEDELLQRR